MLSFVGSVPLSTSFATAFNPEVTASTEVLTCVLVTFVESLVMVSDSVMSCWAAVCGSVWARVVVCWIAAVWFWTAAMKILQPSGTVCDDTL